MRLIPSTLATLVMAGVASAAPDTPPVEVGQPVKCPLAGPKYGGTARCEYECTKDGKKECKIATCSASGYATYEDAEKALRAKIEAEVRADKGTIKGSITFSISKEF